MAMLLNFTVCSAKVSRYDPSLSAMPAPRAYVPMSKCTRCGAAFSCAMADNTAGACWCTTLPAAVPLPQEAAGCWCRTCLEAHIAELSRTQASTNNAENP
jgi:hypothetical protein